MGSVHVEKVPRIGIKLCEMVSLWEVVPTTAICAGLKRVTPASINLIGCWPEAAEVFLLMSPCYMHRPP